MRKTALRSAGLAAAVSACCVLGAGSALASEGSGPPRHAQAAPVKSPLRCYATSSHPERVVCYRLSAKAEFRHGEIVYVPILIQVPTPSSPPSVTIVDSLNDITPG